MREIANILHFKHKIEWKNAWEIVRFYVPDMLKMYCLRKSNLSLPSYTLDP